VSGRRVGCGTGETVCINPETPNRETIYPAERRDGVSPPAFSEEQTMAASVDPLGGTNLSFVEQLYAHYLEDPTSVDETWHQPFAEMAAEDGDLRAARVAVDGPGFHQTSIFDPPADESTGAPLPFDESALPEVEAEVLDSRKRFLSGIKLFETLPPRELEYVASLAIEKRFFDGQVLFREAEPGSSLFVILSGTLEVRRKNLLIASLHPGEVVGELSVLDSQARSADVVARGEVQALILAGEDLLALMDRRPALARAFISMLSTRLRQRSSQQDKVNQLIHAYRVRGHLLAKLDPLGQPRPPVPELELAHWGLSENDMDTLFSSTTVGGNTVLRLREIMSLLHSTYCQSVGVQFMHIDDLKAKNWLINRLEDSENHRRLSQDEQLRILTKLTDAGIFEDFIHKKFLGAKRFSLEGAETLIPLLDLALEEAGDQGIKEVVIGMAHRGRLNVLVNILGKSPREVFREFADQDAEGFIGRGDVKYHLGYSSDHETIHGNTLHLSLCFNPSHLEFVNPLAAGRVRAKQERFGDTEHKQCMAVLIHGDAAFAGQGVTQELFNMVDLPGYRTGGALHVIVNNQIGFTTSPESGRSTQYATDVARMLQTPIFHVNGEDPEAVAQVVQLAMDYRREFAQDVILDMYCYRRYGHNEGDEPSYTQPLLYKLVRKRKSVREGYLDRLLELGVTRGEADAIEEKRRSDLEKELDESRKPDYKLRGPNTGKGLWRPYKGGPDRDVPEEPTLVKKDKLTTLLRATCTTPESFSLNPKLKRFFQHRLEMAEGNRPLDWGTAEALAFASLVVEGSPVRLSGQDSGRGTFSHRHSVLHDVKNGETYIPLQHLAPDQAHFQVWDSPLSEIGVVGFEYGYSLDTPDGLNLWEAQFGDFCNVAQVFFDQFITSGEDKWQRLSGLVMLLPHGFEGQGPEHSSARLERFLDLAAEDNIQVVNLTTPAQFFHCLRRQVRRPWRKPLVVMSPKSLLRNPQATSSLEEFTEGQFHRVLGDSEAVPKKVKRVLLTSGKVYYDLVQARHEAQRKDVAIVRLEQYYPLAEDLLLKALAPYADGTEVVWVQEEPLNMGAWTFLYLHFGTRLFGRWPLARVGRPKSASPATGSMAAHKQEQADLIAQALGS
jgi:2-oxoglutarate dehydrogenase E1 component